MSALLLKERIEVETNHGKCEIQLNFGSITKLEREDKVDVLVVSAFPGDYAPTPTSVIGALKRDLNINVRKLSENKEEDYRRLFSCWWSKPLPKECSYGRILCFEGSFKRSSKPPMVVGEVFRCLISMCKEKDIKAIMPLLAAGDQGYSQQMMLRLIVEAAIHWMRIGLPLKVLKIVVFERSLDKTDSHPLLSHFRQLKGKWAEILKTEDEKPVVHPINYDVYLSYNSQDQKLAEVVVEKLKEIDTDVRIYSEHQSLDSNVSWQEEIYQVMVTSARVITILSPRFLADESCLEQYNIALCCTRNMKRDYLAPFYIDSIEQMPTYMCLIQYVDCRPLDYEKISQACSSMASWLQTHLAEIQPSEAEAKNVTMTKPFKIVGYDVFISYSHQNSAVAHNLQKHLSLFYPHWNIFIDIAELQTGVSWQVKLYNSIESSRYVITLISSAYLKSKVCQEEYNLASALHSDPGYETRLIPILVENVEKLPPWCQNYSPIDLTEMSDRAKMEIIQKISLFEKINQLEKPQIAAIEDVTSNWRSEHLLSGMKYFQEVTVRDVKEITPTALHKRENTNYFDVVLSFHENDAAHAHFLVERLQYYAPGITFSLPEKSKVRHSLLDDASLIVPLLSGSFVRSPELSEELNTALCRQRFTNRLVLFPIALESLPPSPAYFRLLWSVLSCSDKVWHDTTFLAMKGKEKPFPTLTQRCLDFAARLISFILINLSLFQGSYKTLLSTEELLETTLRLRSKQKIDLSGHNPLYFDQARTGHMVSEVRRKDLCHVNSMEDFKETSNYFDPSKKKISPIQDSSPAKHSVLCSESDEAQMDDTGQEGNKDKKKLSKQPSEHTEELSDRDHCNGTDNLDIDQHVNKLHLEDMSLLATKAPLQEGESDCNAEDEVGGKKSMTLLRHQRKKHLKSKTCSVS